MVYYMYLNIKIKGFFWFISVPLYNHLEQQNVEFLQFSFRWMNNLLMREIPLRCTVRLWDTYQVRKTIII
jgi:hypothetical protein